MPRPNKTFRRQKTNAALAYKRGDKKEAYKLWEEAAKGIKELHAKRHNKKAAAKAAEEEKAAS